MIRNIIFTACLTTVMLSSTTVLAESIETNVCVSKSGRVVSILQDGDTCKSNATQMTLAAKGETGDKGDKGDTGPKGDPGPMGGKGDAGPKGATGVAGPQGKTGNAGPKGDAGPMGDKGDAGPQGDTGVAGPQGETGNAGPKGDAGPMGDKGDPGPKGDKGDTGLAGQDAELPQGMPGNVLYYSGSSWIAAAPSLLPEKDNMQPYVAVNCIIALQGIFPSRSSEPFIGQIMFFAGNFVPRGWAFCDGQLLPIAQYTALFSILGTTYGGDGRTTFKLPDMRGRVLLHAGTGPGLERRSLGAQGGKEAH